MNIRGYDFDFVDLSPGHTCSLRLIGMQNPVQTVKCGNHFRSAKDASLKHSGMCLIMRIFRINSKTFTQVDYLLKCDLFSTKVTSVHIFSSTLIYLTIRPVARKGYGSIAHEAKPNGLLIRGP